MAKFSDIRWEDWQYPVTIDGVTMTTSQAAQMIADRLAEEMGFGFGTKKKAMIVAAFKAGVQWERARKRRQSSTVTEGESK